MNDFIATLLIIAGCVVAGVAAHRLRSLWAYHRALRTYRQELSDAQDERNYWRE